MHGCFSTSCCESYDFGRHDIQEYIGYVYAVAYLYKKYICERGRISDSGSIPVVNFLLCTTGQMKAMPEHYAKQTAKDVTIITCMKCHVWKTGVGDLVQAPAPLEGMKRKLAFQPHWKFPTRDQ